MFVRTERMFLRPAWPEDADELVQTLASEDAVRDVGVSPLPHGTQEVRDYLARRCDPHLPDLSMYLRIPGGARLVGGIGLARYEGEVEIGYWIAPAHRGRGFACEALRALLDQARTLGYQRIIASHFQDCPGTHRVLEAAGFHDTGKVRSRYDPDKRMEYAARIYVADLSARAPAWMAAQALGA